MFRVPFANLDMGDWDTFCAVCGAVTVRPWQDESEDESQREEPSYDPAIITHGEMEWLGNMTLLTQNTRNSAYTEVKLLEPARSADFYGNFMVGAEDQEDQEDQEDEDDGTHYKGYDFQDEHPLTFPIHSACYEQLCQAAAPSSLDLDALYETFVYFTSIYGGSCLDINYLGAEDFMQQFWVQERGAEKFVTSPSSSRKLDKWYRSLIDSCPTVEVSLPSPSVGNGSSSGDPFIKLHNELLAHIMTDMHLVDVCRWKEASRAASRLTLPKSFWRIKLRQDMPWLYDFPEVKHDAVDWEVLYKSLHRAACSKAPQANTTLANRKRIWAICDDILKTYRYRKALKDATRPGRLSVLDGAVFSHMSLPEPKGVTTKDVLFIKEFDDLITKVPTLVFKWTRFKELADVDIDSTTSQFDYTWAKKEHKMWLCRGDWLEQIVLVTKQEMGKHRIVDVELSTFVQQPVRVQKVQGDEHTMAAQPGHFIVGFRVSTTAEGIVAGLSLIQQPISKAPEWARFRFSYLYKR